MTTGHLIIEICIITLAIVAFVYLINGTIKLFKNDIRTSRGFIV